MRPGLVVVGVSLLVLAASSVVVLFIAPMPAGTTTNTTTTTWTAPADSENSTAISGQSGVAESLAVQWQASQPISGAFYTTGGCGSGAGGAPCPLELRASWNGTRTGAWSVNGTVACPCRFSWTNAGSSPSAVVLTTVTTVTASSSYSPLSELVLGLGAGVLGFGGAIALFLGLFLRGGVLAGPRPVVPRHPDDGAELEAAPPPRSGGPPGH